MFLCVILSAVSLFLIIVEIGARIDRRHIVLGATNVVFCTFCLIDTWFQPEHLILILTKMEFILVSFFPPMVYWSFALINGNVNKAVLNGMFAAGAVFTMLFVFFPMLTVCKGDVITTLLFNCTFAPYIVFMIAAMLYFTATHAFRAGSPQRRFKIIFFIGLLMISISGIYDLIMLYKGNSYPENTPEEIDWYIWGLLIFVLGTTYIFIEQLYKTARERRETLAKLTEAYRELEQAQALKEIGQSATIINHEIRNFLFAIGANARLLIKETVPDEKRKRLAGNISDTVSQLTAFSNEVLDLSKSKIIADKKPLNLAVLARATVEKNFKNFLGSVVFDEQIGDETVIDADGAKIEHVFVNLIKNALEAGADRIRIATAASDQIVLCTVDDNGSGCTPEELKNLFSAFYTTKKEKGGTGLGLSLVRAVVQSHGGAISVYSKNGITDSQTGLIFCMSFLRQNTNSEDDFDRQNPIVIVKEGIHDLAPILHAFANVQINPRVVATLRGVEAKLSQSDGITVCTAAYPVPALPGFRHYELQHNSSGYCLIKSANTRSSHELLTEEYLLKNIIGQSMRLAG